MKPIKFILTLAFLGITVFPSLAHGDDALAKVMAREEIILKKDLIEFFNDFNLDQHHLMEAFSVIHFQVDEEGNVIFFKIEGENELVNTLLLNMVESSRLKTSSLLANKAYRLPIRFTK